MIKAAIAVAPPCASAKTGVDLRSQDIPEFLAGVRAARRGELPDLRAGEAWWAGYWLAADGRK